MEAGGAVADDLDFEAGGGGLFDDFAHGQAEERGDTYSVLSECESC